MRKIDIVLVFLLLANISCHYIPKVQGPNVQIKAYTEQAKDISIPFHKCFQVDTELPANKKYIEFRPSSLKLTQVASGQIRGKQSNVSVLEDLRSPQTFSHEHLFVFSNYCLSFLSPNQVLIIKEKVGSFQLVNQYKLKDLDQYSRFKMYKIGQKVFLTYYPSAYSRGNAPQLKILALDENGYKEVHFPRQAIVSHMVSSGNQLFSAEFSDGVGIYSIKESDGTIKFVTDYNAKHFNTSSLYLVDINVNNLKSDQIIYALDGVSGVYKINLTKSTQEPQIQLVIRQPNCNAIDSLSHNHIVLVCQLGSSVSYIIEAYADFDQNQNKWVFKKLQPTYHLNYFNDIESSKNYFMVFSHKILNVYWSSKENNLPETVDTRSQLDLAGLQSFHLQISPNKNQKSYLYAIQSGFIKKYEITQSEAILSAKSVTPLQKSFKVSIFGNCQDLVGFGVQDNKGMTCELQRMIDLQVSEQSSLRKQDFNFSASIIVILIMAFLLIIWICLKKYSRFEREARRVLQAYKKKKVRI